MNEEKSISNLDKIENTEDIDKAELENLAGSLLVSKNLTISTAESCTGGLLAGTLINYPGISSSFLEGVITYSNEAKIKRLNVKKETLETFGAVSKETAREMAEGIVKAANTDVGISVTGIAGPGGGTVEKPVGLVYVGLKIREKVMVKELKLNGSRKDIRNATVNIAIKWLINELKSI